MQKFIILVGIPGSGKSTQASKLAADLKEGKEKFEIISSDHYREMLFGDASIQEHGDVLFKCIYSDLETFLTSGKTVIFDATNVKYKDRKKALDIVKYAEKRANIKIQKQAYIMCTAIETCIDRDAKRDKPVTAEVIWRFAKSYNCPQYFEGFDLIKFTNFNENNEENCRQRYLRMFTFDQQNPHHKYLLGIHCTRLAQIAFEEGEDDVFIEAAKMHDIGKLDTQTIDEKGIAHYYSHENISTLRAIEATSEEAFDLDTNKLLDVYFIINNHMHIRDIKTEKSINKYTKLWGEDKLNLLKRFEQYDNLASGVKYNK